MLLLLALVGCEPAEDTGDWAPTLAEPLPSASYRSNGEPFAPLPQTIEHDAKAAALGEKLYADASLSGDGKCSCLSCHAFAKAGTDGEVYPAAGDRDELGPNTNAGTIFNLAFNFRYNWNGKFASIADQLDAPINGKKAMATNWKDLTARVSGTAAYRAGFAAAYADGVTTDNIRHALVEYQRSLITPNAPFDKYLRGDPKALNREELDGYRLFRDLGCMSCHQGINIGGNMFAKLGAMAPYFKGGAEDGPKDGGRIEVTGKLEDKYVFRVPSLRNVALTAPYLHNGSQDSLDAVVRVMGLAQLGRELDQEQVDKLVAFLHTLTGEYRGNNGALP